MIDPWVSLVTIQLTFLDVNLLFLGIPTWCTSRIGGNLRQEIYVGKCTPRDVMTIQLCSAKYNIFKFTIKDFNFGVTKC